MYSRVLKAQCGGRFLDGRLVQLASSKKRDSRTEWDKHFRTSTNEINLTSSNVKTEVFVETIGRLCNQDSSNISRIVNRHKGCRGRGITRFYKNMRMRETQHTTDSRINFDSVKIEAVKTVEYEAVYNNLFEILKERINKLVEGCRGTKSHQHTCRWCDSLELFEQNLQSQPAELQLSHIQQISKPETS
jgi:hypothetical protein